MALISIAIAIFVQTSGMFNDRLLLIQRRAETKLALMHLSVFLDDLSEVKDVPAECPIMPNEIVCIFHSPPADSEKRIPIFSLATHGFVNALWATSTTDGVLQHSLILTDAASKNIRVNFGIFPGVHFIYE
jgi:hypothetical protein